MGKDDGRKVMNGLILILFLGFLAIWAVTAVVKWAWSHS